MHFFLKLNELYIECNHDLVTLFQAINIITINKVLVLSRLKFLSIYRIYKSRRRQVNSISLLPNNIYK